MPFFRVTLACDGIPANEAPQAATDIADEFHKRAQHQNVTCKWDGHSLLLQAENDFDDQGLALLDEFSDAISACVRTPFDGDIRIVSINKL